MAAKKEKTRSRRRRAISIIYRIGTDRHHVQHGRNHRDIRVCVAVPDRRKALHLMETNHAFAAISADRFCDGCLRGLLPSQLGVPPAQSQPITVF
jgi:hypothetical protein